MTLPKMSRLHPVRRRALHPSPSGLRPLLQDALSRALGIPTRRRRPLYFPFSSANPQINAPQRIAPALLQPFVEQQTSLLLLHPEFRSIPALLTAFDEQALQATARQPTRLLPY